MLRHMADEELGNVGSGSLVTVAYFRDLMSAELAKAMLESAGITCFLKDEHILRLGYWVTPGGIQLQVGSENENAARELLDQSEQPSPSNDDADPTE